MAKSGYFQRYLLIIRIIRENPYISFFELKRELEKEFSIYGDSDSMGLSKRTIRRDFDDIKDVFKIEILYSRANNGYYIHEEDTDFVDRKLEYFDLLGTLDAGLDNILFPEKKKSRGTEYLYPLISSIKHSHLVEFRYRKFDNSITKERRIVEPYALKEFKNRWYLLAIERDGRLEERGLIKTWGLDRIENLTKSNQLFDKNPDISIEEEFKNCFGIYSDDDKEVEEVILSFAPISGRYNEALPLHPSQKTLVDNEKELRISLQVKITYDFVMELLSQSETINVLAPKHLKDKMVEIYKNAIKRLK